jgi:hypothetical protein
MRSCPKADIAFRLGLHCAAELVYEFAAVVRALPSRPSRVSRVRVMIIPWPIA